MLKATRQHGSPENGQVDDLQSLTWRAISESNIIILNRLIKEIVQNDKSPPQLLEATNTILETLSHIKVTMIPFWYPHTHVTDLCFFLLDVTEPERGFRETPSRRLRLSLRYLEIIQSKVPVNLATPQFGQGYRKTRKVCRRSVWGAISDTLFAFIGRCTASMDLWQENARRSLPNECWLVASAYVILESLKDISGSSTL